MKQLDPNQVTGAILVVLPKFIGDAINTLPAIAMLHQLYPNNEIHVLARPYMCDIFARDEQYQIKVISDKRYDRSDKHSMWSMAKSLKRYNFAMAVLFRGSLGEAVLCKLAGVKRVLGYRQNGRTPLLSHGLKLNINHHYIQRYCRLVNDCHGHPFSEHILPQLHYDETQLVTKQEGVLSIGVYFGGQNKGPRHYPKALALQTLLALSQQHQVHYYLLGDPSEQSDNQVLTDALSAEKVSVENLSGKTTLTELVDCIAACDLMISIDSGPMHMAAAVDTPCVAVVGFGTSPWSVVAPKNHHFIALTSNSCSLNDEKIIEAIKPEQITQAASSMLTQIVNA